VNGRKEVVYRGYPTKALHEREKHCLHTYQSKHRRDSFSGIIHPRRHMIRCRGSVGGSKITVKGVFPQHNIFMFIIRAKLSHSVNQGDWL
jgi:hypothetical protein